LTELLRALGALCEAPTEAHLRLAAALALDGEPRPDEHTELFGFQLYPYASVYLGGEGKLGGEARDRVAGFWRALGLTPPPEPDHLAALLGLYAALAERGAPPSWRRALLWEHLLSWTPPFLAKLDELAPAFYRRWGALLDEALSAEARALGPLPGEPLAHRAAPALQAPDEIGGTAFLEQLLAPVRTGFVLVRDDLATAARALGLGLRVAERRYVLAALMAQDAGGTLGWLARYAGAWSARHSRPFWRERANAAASLLATAARQAGGAEPARAAGARSDDASCTRDAVGNGVSGD
jgi:TorA maturation chaperone TorD